MPRGKRLTNPERQRIVLLYIGGCTMRVIAERLGLSTKTVSNVIRSLGPEPGVCPECGHPEND